MLAKKYRLTGRIETEFFARARKKSLSFAVLYFVPVPEVETAIIAVIAVKKQFAKSVTRHQAKRKLYQAIAGIMRELSPGKYVFVLKPAILTREIELLTQELREKLVKT